MLIRNRIARGIAAGALVLAAPALAGCGMNFATDQVYTPAVGANDRTTDITVLNAVIVSNNDGEGTLLATFVNKLSSTVTNDYADVDDRFVGVSGAFQATLSGTAKDYTIGSAGRLVLANGTNDVPGIPLDGDFKIGDFVTVEFEFAKAGLVTLDVPVICNTNHYAGQDINPKAGDEIAEVCVQPTAASGSAAH